MYYSKQCLGSMNPELCEKNVTSSIGVDYAKIEECYKQSFEGSEPLLDDNKYLKEE